MRRTAFATIWHVHADAPTIQTGIGSATVGDTGTNVSAYRVADVDIAEATRIPGPIRLAQNVPNPFSPEAAIRFECATDQPRTAGDFRALRRADLHAGQSASSRGKSRGDMEWS